MAEMNAALVAEGQRTLIIGNRVAFQDRATGSPQVIKYVNTYTSNADASLGYNLEGDRAMGEPSTRVCVAGKFTNMRLYDARRPGTPREAWRGGDFDQSLRDNEARGIRPMLQADSLVVAPDGSVRIGNGITQFYNERGEGGFMVVNLRDGAAADTVFIADLTFTPTALARLEALSR
jgi:hypothetical protein